MAAGIRSAQPARAHAQLVRSTPEDNSILEDPPGEVQLWFNEAISARFSSARVLDASGAPINLLSIHRAPEDDRLLILTLPPLTSGLYRVDWRVLSETDGHFTAGILVFGVGDVEAIQAAPIPEASTPPASEIILRWLNYATLVALTGAIMINAMVVRKITSPSLASSVVLEGRRRLLIWTALCSHAALVIGIGILIYQGVTLRNVLPQGVSLGETIWQLLGNSRWGALWTMRQGIVLVLSLGLTLILWFERHPTASEASHANENMKPDLPSSLVLTGGGLAVLALWTAHALNSHAAGLARGPWLAVIVDVVHLLAASVWIGGLVALVIAFLPPIFRGQLDLPMSIRVVWGRFSYWAATCVALLFLTGLYSVGRQVASLDALLTSLYGRAILGKVGAMLLMGLFGLLNAMLVHPVVARPLGRLFHRASGWTPISARQFSKVVMIEISLGLVVLFVAGIITATEPARGPRFPTSRGEVPASQTQSVEDLLITLAVRPNRPGENIITVRAISSWRPPPGEITRVILRIKPQEVDVNPVSVDALPVGSGEYQLGGRFFRFGGVWDVEVVIRRGGIEDQVAHFEWIVPAEGTSRPPIISNYPWESTLTGFAGALLVGLIATLTGIWLVRRF